MHRLVPLAALFLSTVTGLAAAAGDTWPQWRGPTGDGQCDDPEVPVNWNASTGENILWKVAIPGTGHASPIVWRDKLFVVTYIPETDARVLLCYNAHTGAEIWQQLVIDSPPETKHNLNSFASSTPATDGKLVYVSFLEVDGTTAPAKNVGKARPLTPGKMVIAAYDFNGRQQWLVRPGEFQSVHGYCSNPIVYQDLVIINGDHDGDSYIVALKKDTGEIAWKVPRANQTRSYVTPIIRTIDGRTQLILSGSKSIYSLNPADGSTWWHIDGPTEQFVASMVYDGDMLYMVAGFPTDHVMAIRPNGTGNVTDTHVHWHVTNAKCYVPSPVVIGKYLLVADDRGTANCFDTATGQRHWQERLGKHYSASLLAVNGLAYFLADDGVCKVVRPGPELDVVATNPIGEYCFASPAIAHHRLYLRSEHSLFCVGINGDAPNDAKPASSN